MVKKRFALVLALLILTEYAFSLDVYFIDWFKKSSYSSVMLSVGAKRLTLDYENQKLKTSEGLSYSEVEFSDLSEQERYDFSLDLSILSLTTEYRVYDNDNRFIGVRYIGRKADGTAANLYCYD
ncbi:MAG: hypothetical protein MJ183_03970 [Treponemataceae bacterium]|nr:hypothetical protein [Treponemataceae bacterium]